MSWSGCKYCCLVLLIIRYITNRFIKILTLLYRLPTDVQAEAIPLILGGGDVLMAAETGSGKTGAFCIPILQIVWETLKDIESGKAYTKVGEATYCT